MIYMSPLGTRMKAYEAATGVVLPSNSWTVLRLDGKAFHSYTKNLTRPFDEQFQNDMTTLMTFLAYKVGNAVFAYTQSDEISIICHDLGSPEQQHWFGGKVQKIVSVAASFAGAEWASLRGDFENYGVFDARVFSVPSAAEVRNYLLWRQQDCLRNALFMAASEFYSHKELLGKNALNKLQMLAQAGKFWDEDYSDRVRFGAMAARVAQEQEVSYTRKDTGEEMTTLAARSFWISSPAVTFRSNIDSPVFRFLRPEEPPCQPQEFLSLGHTPA